MCVPDATGTQIQCRESGGFQCLPEGGGQDAYLPPACSPVPILFLHHNRNSRSAKPLSGISEGYPQKAEAALGAQARGEVGHEGEAVKGSSCQRCESLILSRFVSGSGGHTNTAGQAATTPWRAVAAPQLASSTRGLGMKNTRCPGAGPLPATKRARLWGEPRGRWQLSPSLGDGTGESLRVRENSGQWRQRQEAGSEQRRGTEGEPDQRAELPVGGGPTGPPPARPPSTALNQPPYQHLYTKRVQRVSQRAKQAPNRLQ